MIHMFVYISRSAVERYLNSACVGLSVCLSVLLFVCPVCLTVSLHVHSSVSKYVCKGFTQCQRNSDFKPGQMELVSLGRQSVYPCVYLASYRGIPQLWRLCDVHQTGIRSTTLGFRKRQLRTGLSGGCLRSIALRTRSGARSYWIGESQRAHYGGHQGAGQADRKQYVLG